MLFWNQKVTENSIETHNKNKNVNLLHYINIRKKYITHAKILLALALRSYQLINISRLSNNVQRMR